MNRFNNILSFICVKAEGIILLLILGVFISACNKEESSPCFCRSGDEAEKTFLLDYFDEIQIDDIFNVYLSEDTFYGVTFKGGENILDHVRADITDGRVLTLNNDIKCRWMRDYDKIDVVVSFDSISDIYVNMACKLETLTPLTGYEIRYWPISDLNEAYLDLNCERFFLLSYGASTGEIYISGKCNFFNAGLYGAVSLDAMNLNSRGVIVTNGSTNDAWVNGKGYLNLYAEHYGNIYYKKNKAWNVKKVEKGKGKVIEVE